MRTNILRFLLFSLSLFVTSGVCSAQTSGYEANKSKTMPGLTATQLEAIKSIRAGSEKKAAPLALRLAAATKQIYENMLLEKEDEALRQKLSEEMNKAVVGILAIKGQSIRDMVKVLTAEQRQLIKNEMHKPDAAGDLSEIIMRVFSIPEK